MTDWLAKFRSRRLGETALMSKPPKLPKPEERVGFGTFGTFGNAALDETERPTPCRSTRAATRARRAAGATAGSSGARRSFATRTPSDAA